MAQSNDEDEVWQDALEVLPTMEADPGHYETCLAAAARRVAHFPRPAAEWPTMATGQGRVGDRAAIIARAAVDRAWDIRGMGGGKSLSRDQSDGFHGHPAFAGNHLGEGVESAPDNASLAATAIPVLRGLGRNR